MNNLKVTVKILILVAISIVGMLFVGYRGYSSIDKATVDLDFLLFFRILLYNSIKISVLSNYVNIVCIDRSESK